MLLVVTTVPDLALRRAMLPERRRGGITNLFSSGSVSQ
jgi:hypothetical protein